MAQWQRLAETNPSASPEQQVLIGLLVVAELENGSSVGAEFASRRPLTSAAEAPRDPR